MSGSSKLLLPASTFAPLPTELPQPSWKDYAVWERVRETLYALPSYFKMDGAFPAIPASDLHSANTLLGAAIEEHIPVALNQMRNTWDPEGKYADCIFKRQPQTFPDVPFRREGEGTPEVLFGIEIKSWYVLAKEAVPSLRLDVNQAFCHEADLCVVYPWALSAAVSGTPKLFRPLVIGAKTAARIRNEYWLAKATSDEWKEIRGAKATPTFHPVKSDNINDFAPRDHDNNFGRIARSGVWTQKIAQLVEEERIAGIPLLGWQTFLGAFKETSTLEKSVQAIQAYLSKSEIGETSQTEEAFSKIAEGMSSLFDILSSAPAVVAKTAKRPKKL